MFIRVHQHEVYIIEHNGIYTYIYIYIYNIYIYIEYGDTSHGSLDGCPPCFGRVWPSPWVATPVRGGRRRQQSTPRSRIQSVSNRLDISHDGSMVLVEKC